MALQYGNAFGQGLQAAALKPADFFGNDDVLYLMEDMATGEIRLSILWEWLHKTRAADGRRRARSASRPATRSRRAVHAAARRGIREAAASRAIATCTTTRRPRRCRSRARSSRPTCSTDVKLPWYIDLLNINLDNHDLTEAKRRIRLLADAFRKDGTRITENLDFA